MGNLKEVYDDRNGHALQVGPADIGQIKRLCFYLDQLMSKQTKAKNPKVAKNLKRAARRRRTRIQNLVNEVHKQLSRRILRSSSLYLCPEVSPSPVRMERIFPALADLTNVVREMPYCLTALRLNVI